jgi:hypothetical protein
MYEQFTTEKQIHNVCCYCQQGIEMSLLIILDQSVCLNPVFMPPGLRVIEPSICLSLHLDTCVARGTTGYCTLPSLRL